MPEVNNYVSIMTKMIEQELPGLDKELLKLYTLLALIKGDKVGLMDVHDAWSVWQTQTQPDHRSIIPFNTLMREVQELDRKYVDGIKRAVHEYRAWFLGHRR